MDLPFLFFIFLFVLFFSRIPGTKHTATFFFRARTHLQTKQGPSGSRKRRGVRHRSSARTGKPLAQQADPGRGGRAAGGGGRLRLRGGPSQVRQGEGGLRVSRPLWREEGGGGTR